MDQNKLCREREGSTDFDTVAVRLFFFPKHIVLYICLWSDTHFSHLLLAHGLSLNSLFLIVLGQLPIYLSLIVQYVINMATSRSSSTARLTRSALAVFRASRNRSLAQSRYATSRAAEGSFVNGLNATRPHLLLASVSGRVGTATNVSKSYLKAVMFGRNFNGRAYSTAAASSGQVFATYINTCLLIFI